MVPSPEIKVIQKQPRKAVGTGTHFCKCNHSRYGTLLSTADTGITRIDLMKCMYTFVFKSIYISTSYYRVLVQELRVFRPQNAPNSVPWNLAANPGIHHVAWGR